MSRDCTESRMSSGGGGGGTCYNCGEIGHFSRDCPNRMSSDDHVDTRKCYNCNESGHLSRDCPDANRRSQSDKSAVECFRSVIFLLLLLNKYKNMPYVRLTLLFCIHRFIAHFLWWDWKNNNNIFAMESELHRPHLLTQDGQMWHGVLSGDLDFSVPEDLVKPLAPTLAHLYQLCFSCWAQCVTQLRVLGRYWITEQFLLLCTYPGWHNLNELTRDTCHHSSTLSLCGLYQLWNWTTSNISLSCRVDKSWLQFSRWGQGWKPVLSQFSKTLLPYISTYEL